MKGDPASAITPEEAAKRGGAKLLLGLLTSCIAALSVLAAFRALWPAFVGVSLVAGLLVFLLWRRGGVSLRQVLVFAALFRLFLFWLPPVLSDDAYRYVWDGMLQVEGVNPYLFTPEDPTLDASHDEPIYPHLNSASYHSIYPPLSQLVFAAGGLFYGWGWAVSYYVIKALFLLMEFGGVLLLARLVTARSLMLYAWNPLVLVETAGQGHTDAALVLFLVGAVWLARQGRGRGASAMLAGAGLIKLYPFVLVPFLWRRFGWGGIWPTLVVLVALTAPYFNPAVPERVAVSLDLYVRLFEFNAGLYYSVKQVFLLATGEDWSKILGPAFRALFLVTLPALYWADWRGRWPLERAFLWALGLYFVLATTVHPWYLLAVLPLAVLFVRPLWHWHWLSLGAVGTYLLYIDGPYWFFVIVGWGGWLVLALLRHHDAALQVVQRRRARQKAKLILPWLSTPVIANKTLDLGAGEGYVGEVLHAKLGTEVTLADVLLMNRTALPFVAYDGRTLPFDDDQFDATLLYFVLHHCEDPEQVVREALRVSHRHVIVVESVYQGAWQHALLRLLDQVANRIRSGGAMQAQEAHLHFRDVAWWRALFEEQGAQIEAERHRGRWIHRQAFFLLRPRIT